jgi:hypothetical protein
VDQHRVRPVHVEDLAAGHADQPTVLGRRHIFLIGPARDKRPTLTCFHPTPPGSPILLQVPINSEEVHAFLSRFPMLIDDPASRLRIFRQVCNEANAYTTGVINNLFIRLRFGVSCRGWFERV